MKAFQYTVAASVEEACGRLGEGAVALSGGTNLLSLMKDHVLEPSVVVDLKRIPDLDRIEVSAERVSIGANVTIDGLLANADVSTRFPVLRQAAERIATPQIRNRSTVGGNLCGRPACWYFSQEAFRCAKKGGEGCPAVAGENEWHAIFDTDGPCVIVHPSTLAPALIALAAEVEVAGPKSRRVVPLAEFFVSPSSTVSRENVLKANEIVTSVRLGGAPCPNSATYLAQQKSSHDWPMALASVVLGLEAGVCRSARIVLGAVAPTPRRVPDAEAALVGKRIDPEAAERAAGLALAGAKPLAQNGYKVSVARACVKRAILVAATGRWQ
jgi:xanthine dehydrogenase YagS FAD-binding subunit